MFYYTHLSYHTHLIYYTHTAHRGVSVASLLLLNSLKRSRSMARFWCACCLLWVAVVTANTASTLFTLLCVCVTKQALLPWPACLQLSRQQAWVLVWLKALAMCRYQHAAVLCACLKACRINRRSAHSHGSHVFDWKSMFPGHCQRPRGLLWCGQIRMSQHAYGCKMPYQEVCFAA